MTQEQENRTEALVYSINKRNFVSRDKDNRESEELNNDVGWRTAVFNYLAQLHKQEAPSKSLVSVTVPYNPDIYPGDTIKYLWEGTTKGGMVFDVSHSIQILPLNQITGTTTINYTTYTLPDMLRRVRYQRRNVNIIKRSPSTISGGGVAVPPRR